MKVMNKSDFWLGILISLGGLWAYLQCRTFDEYSSGYPTFLTWVHIVLGICLIIKSLKESAEDSDSLKRLFLEMRGPLIVAAMLMGWGILLMLDLGFLLSSSIILPMILYSLGYRGARRLAVTTTGIVGAVFVLFYVLFEVPLPLHTIFEQLFSCL